MNWLGKKEMSVLADIPWYYGLCYPRDFGRWYVCYPVPLNWIVWVSIEIWARVRSTPGGILEKAYRQGYEQGKIDGNLDGWIRATPAMKRQCQGEADGSTHDK